MATLSIHGDVHIPDNIIHALGLKPGTELVFERQGDAIIMRPVKTKKSRGLIKGQKYWAIQGRPFRWKRWMLLLPKARCNRCEVGRY
ncbi:MAG: AbrB/MazE/SpoVT family DNA-binding domain-containing protein [Methylococcaceae bacterium]